VTDELAEPQALVEVEHRVELYQPRIGQMDELMRQVDELYERAIFGGEYDDLPEADRALDVVEAALLLQRGRILHCRFLESGVEPPEELGYFERAAELYRGAGDDRGEALARFWIGCFHQVVRDDNGTAVPFLTASVELSRTTGDDLTLSYALRHLGVAAQMSGNFPEARELLEESTALRRTLGDTILRAVEATRRVTAANTNLGMVLLLAPLARAAAVAVSGHDLRDAVRTVLSVTTVGDSERAYEAIRLAAPGGLGKVSGEDVSSAPTRPLLDVMRLAADRDDVAHEYDSGFAITFDVASPVLARLRQDGADWTDAVVQLFLTLLAQRPDTLIVRKAGRDAAASVSARAGEALARGGVRTPEGRAAVDRLDEHLRASGNRLNPGTTADLSAAALFVHLLGLHQR